MVAGGIIVAGRHSASRAGRRTTGARRRAWARASEMNGAASTLKADTGMWPATSFRALE